MRFIVAGGVGGPIAVDDVDKGFGQRISGTVPVSPGQVVGLLAGGRGQAGVRSGTVTSFGGRGYGNGGNGVDGGGGGGAGSSLTVAGQLLIAAGGGGGGGEAQFTEGDGNPLTVTNDGSTGNGGGIRGRTFNIVNKSSPNVNIVTIGGGLGGTQSAPGGGGRITNAGNAENSAAGNAGSGRNGGNGKEAARASVILGGSGGGGGGYFGAGSGGVAWVQ